MTDYGPIAIWVAIALIGVATYLIRLSFIHLFGRIDDVPPALERALRFVPPAVLAGLVAPALITVGPTLEATFLDDRLLAGLVAVLIGSFAASVLFPFVVIPWLAPEIGGVDALMGQLLQGAKNSLELLRGFLS